MNKQYLKALLEKLYEHESEMKLNGWSYSGILSWIIGYVEGGMEIVDKLSEKEERKK